MKKRFKLSLFFLIFSLLFSNNLKAKPRCEVLYDNIYNDLIRKDLN